MKDLKIKTINGKTKHVGRFESIAAMAEHFKKNLRGSDLSWSDLRWSDLRGSDLRGSDLSWSDLRWSDLSESDLRGSDLRGSDLSWSDLRGSDLSESDLRGSDLRGSDLRGSNLDFSCLPLRCGGTNMKIDDRFIGQIAYHLTRQDYSACSNEVKEELERIKKGPLGNLFCNYRNDLVKV